MSPAHSEKPMDMEVFSWVGVIMYLPPNQTNEQRESIKCRFNDYLDLIRPLLEEYKAHAHWAKIEVPSTARFPPTPSSTLSWIWGQSPTFTSTSTSPTGSDRLENLRSRLAERYPLEEFNSYRHALDPHNILTNDMIDKLIT